MSEIVKFRSDPKKAGTALVRTTVNRLHVPMEVAKRCGTELREVLRPVNDVNQHRGYLASAKFNHGRMLSRAAMVSAAHTELMPVVFPHMVATPVVTTEIAVMMLSTLFGSVGKAKTVETATLLGTCVEMFHPVADVIGEATGLWTPISKHPVVLALAVRKLINTSVFTSAAEFRQAMQDARNSILWLMQHTERWLDLLRISDRVLFEFDRPAWDRAYASVGADVARVMQDSDEEGYEDDDGEDVPPSPRWAALQAMIEAGNEPSPG
ncbi:hypothetical protein JQ582_19850 [Bradyrhizobium japonicum]|uniref:hypothetical protein n=1 Tax=Bradyrhizobium japonicum TaxID=375 RepID=UPI001BA4DD6A|nr:hypothetical protein [Bradyrhizobium japonicum]MBR0746189.1 hypothetical protein [Bradyrhizobium japonicum]